MLRDPFLEGVDERLREGPPYDMTYLKDREEGCDSAESSRSRLTGCPRVGLERFPIDRSSIDPCISRVYLISLLRLRAPTGTVREYST